MSEQQDTETLLSEALEAISKVSNHFERRNERTPMYEANKAWQIIHALTDREKRRRMIVEDLKPTTLAELVCEVRNT